MAKKANPYFKGNEKQEVVDFLGRFGIAFMDCEEDFIKTHRSWYLEGVHLDTIYYKVLLETLRLLPDAVYEKGRCRNMRLWASNPWHSPMDSGFFHEDDLSITKRAHQRTLLNLAYTLLHELGHSIQHMFPMFNHDGFVLPQEYYEDRDKISTPRRSHPGVVNDLLTFFPLATGADIERWYSSEVHYSDSSVVPYVHRETKRDAEKLRKQMVGDPDKRLNQMREFIDLILEAERLSGSIARKAYGDGPTMEYKETLDRIRSRLYNPRRGKVIYTPATRQSGDSSWKLVAKEVALQ